MPNYTIVLGNKHLRAKLYKHDDFFYHKNSSRNGKDYLRCQKNVARHSSCPGTARLDHQTDEITPGRPHNHSAEEYNLELELKKDIKRAASQSLTNERKSEIFHNTCRGHPDADKVAFG